MMTKKVLDAYVCLDVLSIDDMRSLSTTKLLRFAGLCAHWADLSQSELGKRSKGTQKK